MVCVLIRHTIADYEKWRRVFDASMSFRQAGGEKSCRIFRDPEHPEHLTLFFEWENLEQARRFMALPELRQRMQEAGVVGEPEVHFLREQYTVRRSAAD
jgi:hypothetical protein